MRKIFLILLFFCILLTFAADTTPQDSKIDKFNISDPSTWMGIALLIIIIHLTLVSLAYMLAGMFEDEELKAWCKNEVIQAIYSAIIIGSILSVLLLLNGLSNQFFADIVNPSSSCSGDSCHSLRTDLSFNSSTNRWSESESSIHVSVDGAGNVKCFNGTKEFQPCDPKFLMARSYLGITYEKLAGVLRELARNYAIYSSIDSFSISSSLFFGSQTFGLNMFAGFPVHPIIINTLGQLITFTEKLMMLIKFQESILKYFEFGLAGTLILLGIFLRSIWVFRKAGGTFLAMGIAFMFVLPLMYSLGWYTIDIKPIREAGISEKKSLNEILPGEIGSQSLLDTIGMLFRALASSKLVSGENLITTSAIILAIVTFLLLRYLEIGSVIGTVTGIAKSPPDVVVFVSLIIALLSLGTVSITGADELYTDFTNGKIGYFDLISRYALVAIALPLINFYVVFSFIRGLSPLLGGEPDIPGLSRLL